MIKTILKFKKHVSHNNILDYYKVILISLFAAFAELLTISSIIPFVSAIFNLNRVRTQILSLIGLNTNILSDNELILTLIVIFIFLVVFGTFVRVYLQKKVVSLSYNIGFNISTKLFDKLIFQSYDEYVKLNSSVIISNITNKTNAIIGNVIMPFIVLSSSFFLISSILFFLLYLSPKIAIFAFLYFFIIYFFIGRFLKKKLNNNSVIMAISSDKIVSYIQESTSNFRDIYLYNLQTTIINSFNNVENDYRKSQSSNAFLTSSPRYMVESFGIIFLIMMSVYFYFSEDQQLDKAMPLIAGFAFGSQKLIPIFQQIYISWSNYNGSKRIFQDVFYFLNKKTFKEDPNLYLKDFKFSKKITLQNISFGFNNENSLFENISVEIKKGQRICIRGESGIGKSTLVDILIGFIKPTKGKVLFDGTSSKNISPSYIKSLISNVPQNIFISNNSIIQNIATGVNIKDIDLSKVKRLIKQVSLDKWVSNLPMGLETILSENGKNLSGGQKQRIGIARSLYKDPQIIIFDEATSSLDTKTEKIIVDTINNISTDITIIFITHDTNFLPNYDRSFKLINKKIIEL
tara:strand:+ start:13613 stop:15337 length:1725 start_codon:yes stop_codon:yes gene_type:complete